MCATNWIIAGVGAAALAMLATNAHTQERVRPPRADASKGAVAVSPIKERLPKLLDELVKAQKSNEQIIEAVYLAALTRLPTESEAKQAQQQVVGSKDRVQALDKILKGLVASPEFTRLHPDAIPLRLVPLDRLPDPKQDPNAPGKGPFFNRLGAQNNGGQKGQNNNGQKQQKNDGQRNQKEDGQQNQKDDGQQNQNDDGERNQKNDGQQNQKNDGRKNQQDKR